MHDDEFPTIIGSGSDHRISVSEFTGNAKTPQNNVKSHEQETEARKRAFEAQALAVLEEKKALANALAEHANPALPPDAADTNIQQVADDKITTNRQNISAGNTKPNVQAVATDQLQDNRQLVNDGNNTTNIQNIAADKAVASNRQNIGQEPQAKNVQGIPTDGASANTQQLAMPGTQDNRQPLAPATAMAPNNQVIGADDPSLNRQAAPQNVLPSPNRQGLDNGKIQSHFEALPSDRVERKLANLPLGESQRSHATPAGKLALAPRAPMTAQELEDSKRQREKFSEAFHGRLAGIKHNVEELNERLSDFEEKVQKDDAKLIKGNPNDFKVDLG